MRAWAYLCVLLVGPLAALAQEHPPFDPEGLDPQDTRFLQAALVWSGDYAGLTDGYWGERSAAGLAAWLRRAGADPGEPAESDLLPLLANFAAEVAAGGWMTVNLDDTLTVALPTALLLAEPPGANRAEFRSPPGDLVFRLLFGLPDQAWDMHAWMMASHVGEEIPYQSLRDDRMVTAVTLPNGQRIYLRTALIWGLAISMQVESEPGQRPRADLIASSMQWGTAPDLAPAPGGRLERILMGPGGTDPPALAFLPPPASASRSVPPAASPLATGTGFFVNNTNVVTAAHVVENCRDVRLQDGSPLHLLSADPALDLAVLVSERRSEHWLSVSLAEGPRLGEPIFALGFPYFGIGLTDNQGLSVTGGNVSALPRVAGAESRVMVTAPIQPGNSGGPLLGREGDVLGVVVAIANGDAVRALTGTLPQNMNFATSVGQLVPFLQAARVLIPEAEPPAKDLSQGIPDEVQAAVVLIACH